MAKDLQFGVSYQPVQDRLHIAGVFPDGSEVRLLFTRRLVRNLLGTVGQLAEKMVPAKKVTTPAAKKEVAKFKRDATVQQADFSKKFEGGAPHHELGAEAQVVTEIQLSTLKDGRIRLKIALVSQKLIETNLPAQTFWGLIHLIKKQAATAQWDLGPRAQVAAKQEKPRFKVKPRFEVKVEKPRLN